MPSIGTSLGSFLPPREARAAAAAEKEGADSGKKRLERGNKIADTNSHAA